MKNCGRDLIRSIKKNADDYDEKYMKIKFNSGDELPLNKTSKFIPRQQLLELFFMKVTNFIHRFFQMNVYDILYKTSAGAKPLRFMFDKIDGFIKVHNRVRYLVLFDYGWCDEICNNINHNFG